MFQHYALSSYALTCALLTRGRHPPPTRGRHRVGRRDLVAVRPAWRGRPWRPGRWGGGGVRRPAVSSQIPYILAFQVSKGLGLGFGVLWSDQMGKDPRLIHEAAPVQYDKQTNGLARV